MKINHKGFSPVAIILLIVLVGLVGATGWYVYNSNKKTNESLNNAQNSVNSAADSKKATATTKPSATPTPTPTPQSTQKYLVIKEWGIELSGIEANRVGYKMEGNDTAVFIIPNSTAVSDECRPLSLGITRSKEKITEGLKYLDGYYYHIGGGPGACTNDVNTSDNKIHVSAIEYITSKLSTYTIIKI